MKLQDRKLKTQRFSAKVQYHQSIFKQQNKIMSRYKTVNTNEK